MRTDKRTADRRLTERLVTPGCRVMKLDKKKGKPPKFPFLPGSKKKKDRHNTLEHMRRVGRVSMIQIGDDEFRTPSRAERRQAGITHRKENVLQKIAAKRGTAMLPKLVVLEPSLKAVGDGMVEMTAAGAQRRDLSEYRQRPYTRKAKRLRKAILEHNAFVEAQYELLKMWKLVYHARGYVGPTPLTQEVT